MAILKPLRGKNRWITFHKCKEEDVSSQATGSETDFTVTTAVVPTTKEYTTVLVDNEIYEVTVIVGTTVTLASPPPADALVIVVYPYESSVPRIQASFSPKWEQETEETPELGTDYKITDKTAEKGSFDMSLTSVNEEAFNFIIEMMTNETPICIEERTERTATSYKVFREAYIRSWEGASEAGAVLDESFSGDFKTIKGISSDATAPTKLESAEIDIDEYDAINHNVLIDISDYVPPADVKNYMIYRDITVFTDLTSATHIATITDMEYLDKGLDPSTQYWYTAVPVDRSGNKVTTGLNTSTLTTAA